MTKFKLITALLSAFLLFSGQANAKELDLQAEWLIKLQIQELADQYAIQRDNDNAEGYANTFAEDGTLILYGTAYTGRDVIAEKVRSAGTGAIRMHVISTSHIEVIDEKTARGVHYATVYSATKPENYNPEERIPVANFRTMGKYHDKYVLTNEGWKFSERRLEALFSPAE